MRSSLLKTIQTAFFALLAEVRPLCTRIPPVRKPTSAIIAGVSSLHESLAQSI